MGWPGAGRFFELVGRLLRDGDGFVEWVAGATLLDDRWVVLGGCCLRGGGVFLGWVVVVFAGVVFVAWGGLLPFATRDGVAVVVGRWCVRSARDQLVDVILRV